MSGLTKNLTSGCSREGGGANTYSCPHPPLRSPMVLALESGPPGSPRHSTMSSAFSLRFHFYFRLSHLPPLPTPSPLITVITVISTYCTLLSTMYQHQASLSLRVHFSLITCYHMLLHSVTCTAITIH